MGRFCVLLLVVLLPVNVFAAGSAVVFAGAAHSESGTPAIPCGAEAMPVASAICEQMPSDCQQIPGCHASGVAIPNDASGFAPAAAETPPATLTVGYRTPHLRPEPRPPRS